MPTRSGRPSTVDDRSGQPSTVGQTVAGQTPPLEDAAMDDVAPPAVAMDTSVADGADKENDGATPLARAKGKEAATERRAGASAHAPAPKRPARPATLDLSSAPTAVRKLNIARRFTFNLDIRAVCVAMGGVFETRAVAPAALDLDMFSWAHGDLCVLEFSAPWLGAVPHSTTLRGDREHWSLPWSLRIIRNDDLPPHLRAHFPQGFAALLIADDTSVRELRRRHDADALALHRVIPHKQKAAVYWHVAALPVEHACTIVDATLGCLRPYHLEWLAEDVGTRMSDALHFKRLTGLAPSYLDTRPTLFAYSSARFL